MTGLKGYDRAQAVAKLTEDIEATKMVAREAPDPFNNVWQEAHVGVILVPPAQVIAEAVLIHLHPIIEDQEALDRLGVGSVVIDSYRAPLNGDVYRSALSNGRVVWFQAGPQGEFHTVCFPAMVLHKSTLASTTELFLEGLISE
ncbi:hypothetical protein HYP71_gp058 [Arthrobacter phage KBurrousTX]|uniref:Uncharacterized protein n=1 Tax=Arthrobacter phage KBurrousTX TaxID=2315608 RepID=A0A386K9V6_9CAUD|nr:hypothetical protein HYP71_gp058 [Arthrobacter phage KBurrousTX]AYD81552.1 hypothetical protein KBurrousTX_58 [Arthrobacter phage KBurrousTX]